MGKSLVIVESPAKAKTINKYLGNKFVVKASVGHVRDLPKKKFGVDEKTFEPFYEILDAKKKVVAELKKAAAGADMIYLAADPDREGEAICWHIAQILDKQSGRIKRILYNEITKKAVEAAIASPVEIDLDKVNAQQARRILDRIVGYKLSPLLWGKVKRGLSAGRVQSVALKMVTDREAQINAFVPQEYWNLAATLDAALPPRFVAKLSKISGKKAEVGNGELAAKIVAASKSGVWTVAAVSEREKKQSPAPPFTTSKLQQAARYPVKRTMGIAQGLYEGKELGELGTVGLITYMRTDSTRVSEDALAAVRSHIAGKYGPDLIPEKAIYYKSKKGSQDAHEAIRPTSLEHEPDRIRQFLTKDEYNIYRLIWNRFVASQMKPALFSVTDADIQVASYTFRASGQILKFAGYLSVFGATSAEGEPAEEGSAEEGAASNEETGREGEAPAAASAVQMPPLATGDRLQLVEMESKQNFTQPPPRFTEATLVKALEENGIGRPSTYASILATLTHRDYSLKEEGKFVPTQLGLLVSRLLEESFADIINESYTAHLEEELDEIEAGKLEWKAALGEFMEKFGKDLALAETNMTKVKGEGVPTDQICERDSAPMVIKFGRFGEFLACTNYPDCKFTKEIAKPGDTPAADDPMLSEPCENCGKDMALKRGRFGPFYACSGYPECKTIRKAATAKQPQALPTGVPCPRCGESEAGQILERRSRRGKIFFGCSRYPKCDFALWNRPIARPCPLCDQAYLVEKTTKKDGTFQFCDREGCDFRETVAPQPEAEPASVS